MEKKQSSVEYFFEEVVKWKIKPWLYVPDGIEGIREKAKAMHKEESELLFECGRNFQLTGEGTFNEVYNETFGGNNE